MKANNENLMPLFPSIFLMKANNENLMPLFPSIFLSHKRVQDAYLVN